MKRFFILIFSCWLIFNSSADDSDDDRGSSPNPSPTLVKLCPTHPNIDAMLKQGAPSYQFPSTHPTVHPLFTNVIPRGHPNLDNLLRRGRHYNGDHPKLEGRYTYRAASTEQCYGFDNVINASGCPAKTSSLHPSVDDSIASGVLPPSNHPLIHDMLKDWMPSTHRNLDDLLRAGTKLPLGHPAIDPYMCRNSSAYRYATGCPANASASHPSIDSSIGTRDLPAGHPLVDSTLRPWMPANHSNIDELMAAKTPLPLGHPLIDPYMCKHGGKSGSSGCTYVHRGHPSVDQKIFAGGNLPGGHPKVHDLLKDFLPAGHGNCDDLLSAGNPLPLWHPSIDAYICQEPLLSAGMILAICCFSLFAIAVVVRFVANRHTNNDVKAYHTAAVKPSSYHGVSTTETTSVGQGKKGGSVGVKGAVVSGGYVLGSTQDDLVPSAPPLAAIEMAYPIKAVDLRLESVSSLEGGGLDGDFIEDPDVPPQPSPAVRSMLENSVMLFEDEAKSVPRRNLQIHNMQVLHAQHKSEEQMYAYGDYSTMPVPSSDGSVVKQLPKHLSDNIPKLSMTKKNTCLQRMKVVLTETRVPYFHWTLGTVLTVVVYLLLNLLCLFATPYKNYGASLGSLAACNIMILVIPASRNSILALGLGMPFDHVVVYHRVIGRVAVLLVIIHGIYYIDMRNSASFAYDTGMGALACGLFIYLTSLNWVRRNLFNVFYWSHYIFVAFLALAYVHVASTKPFIVVAVVLYVIDKVLRCVWMFWPRRTTVFKLKSKDVVQVRFPKNPITKGLEMHRVGQYFFLNFPALSLSEWHPYSVSSGPREDEVEVHIRGLGDHTNRIVAFAKQKEQANEATYVLMDGPYGLSSAFNYRRYPSILMGAGGIGITPILGMLKDIYDIGLTNEQIISTKPHAIETIYFLWVMPHAEDACSFWEELELCIAASKAEDKPNLVLMVYVTRSKDKLKPPFASGRPNIENIFKILMTNGKDHASLVFACGPQALVSELWDKSVQCTLRGHLVDFHHEIFEF